MQVWRQSLWFLLLLKPNCMQPCYWRTKCAKKKSRKNDYLSQIVLVECDDSYVMYDTCNCIFSLWNCLIRWAWQRVAGKQKKYSVCFGLKKRGKYRANGAISLSNIISIWMQFILMRCRREGRIFLCMGNYTREPCIRITNAYNWINDLSVSVLQFIAFSSHRFFFVDWKRTRLNNIHNCSCNAHSIIMKYMWMSWKPNSMNVYDKPNHIKFILIFIESTWNVRHSPFAACTDACVLNDCNNSIHKT